MTLNMVGWDRLVRLIGAAVLIRLSAFLLRFNPLGILLTIVGVILILTALVGGCPLYALIGFRTRR